jgi:hypothetical protein
MRHVHRSFSAAVIGVLIAGTLGAGVTYAATSSKGVKACESSKGYLAVASSKGKCPKHTKAVTIGARGARGLTGAKGVQGNQGIQGIQGIQGDTGPSDGYVDTIRTSEPLNDGDGYTIFGAGHNLPAGNYVFDIAVRFSNPTTTAETVTLSFFPCGTSLATIGYPVAVPAGHSIVGPSGTVVLPGVASDSMTAAYDAANGGCFYMEGVDGNGDSDKTTMTWGITAIKVGTLTSVGDPSFQ